VVSGIRATRLARSVVLVIAGCAATGVTLRSHHYRIYVPPGWQVVEAGGDAAIPTLLRVPPAADGAAGVELRLYAWLAYEAPADPTGDAFRRLADAGVVDPASVKADEQPCPDRMGEFVVFGAPSRAIHVQTATDRRIVVTAAHAYGSLVGVVGIVSPGRSACADVATRDAAVRRLVSAMADNGDPTRPWPPPTIGSQPGQSIPIAPVDPAPLSP
jgi:hypothetical protein